MIQVPGDLLDAHRRARFWNKFAAAREQTIQFWLAIRRFRF